MALSCQPAILIADEPTTALDVTIQAQILELLRQLQASRGMSIMLITLPLYIPIVKLLGYDPIWFGVLMLINLEMALTTPPFGMLLFVMKGVAPVGTKIKAIYLAGLPFLICDLIALLVVLFVPETTSWLQNLFYSR